jgi:hypothetical protein
MQILYANKVFLKIHHLSSESIFNSLKLHLNFGEF